MSAELIGTILTGLGVLVGVWRMLDSYRKEVRQDVQEANRNLMSQIAAVNTRIDNILLSERRSPAPPTADGR